MNEEIHQESYDLGQEYGYESGFDDGFYKAREEYLKELSDEKEQSYKEGKISGEEKITSELDSLRYNFENLTIDLLNQIKELNRQLYDLRKENATTIKSVQKST